MKYRVGASLGRTIYIQHGDEPSKSDEFVGMMETPLGAQLVVETLNREVAAGVQQESSLEEEIRRAINLASAENSSNTPDYLLAEFLVQCLDAFNLATRQRDVWYGVQLAPGRNLQGPAAGGDLG